MKALAVRAHGLREMARLIRRRPASFLLAVLLAAAALTVPIAGATFARSAAPVIRELPLGPEVNLFLASTASAAEIRQLQPQLAARPGVAKVEWISRDAALKALAQRTGAGGFAELKANALPDVLVVTLVPETAPAEVEAAIADLRRLPQVESVAADVDWHRQLKRLLDAAAAAGTPVAGLGVVLLVLSVVAAVRLQLTDAAAHVQVLRLVGADTRFIVRPFAYAGALALGLGMLLASGAAWAGLAAASGPWVELVRAYGAEFELRPLPACWLAGSVACAAIVGGLGASLGARWGLGKLR